MASLRLQFLPHYWLAGALQVKPLTDTWTPVLPTSGQHREPESSS